jgi:hypothetical protein
VLQGVVGGVVRREFGIEVAEDSDANGVAHASIVLEGAAGNWKVAVRGVVRPESVVTAAET